MKLFSFDAASFGFLCGLFLASWQAAAVPITKGSPLTQDANLPLDCAQIPNIADPSGNYDIFRSGVADCTWRLSGVTFEPTLGPPPNELRFSSVDGDGWITSISVRSGANPAPLRFVILRQQTANGFGAEGQCCFLVSETPGEFQPAPNAITTFPTFLPVQNNTIKGFRAVDLVAVSARSGAGSLPLHSTGRVNAFDLTTAPGTVVAGYFYPRVGAIPNDSGGGRREQSVPGVEVLVQFTFCPATDGQAFCAALAGGGVVNNGGNGGNGVNGGGNGTPAPSAGPTLSSQSARVTRQRLQLPVSCVGVDLCAGRIQVFRANGQRVQNMGSKRFRLAAGQQALVPMTLNLTPAARRALRNGLTAGVRFIPASGASIVQAIILTR